MILTDTIEIELNGKKIKHYEFLGYNIPKKKDINYRLNVPKGTKIFVRVEDLPLTSRDEIPYQCDYCFEKGYKQYVALIKGRKVVPKDCCNKCIPLKKRDISIIKYGVEHTSQLESTKKKFKETMLEVHGVEYASQSQKIREKIIKSNLDNFGETNPMKSEEIKNKLKQTFIDKYGVSSPLQSQEIKSKILQSNRDRC